MPELAETARFAKDLNYIIGGSHLKAVKPNINDKFSSRLAPSDAMLELQKNIGKNIGFVSLGKCLFLTLPRLNSVLNIKLGMSGSFQRELKSGFEKHVFWTMSFSNGTIIHFVDPRRFGSVTLQRGADERVREMALGGYNGKNFVMRELPRIHKYMCGNLSMSKAPRITWLLNTGKFTGVGNYMANEALGKLDLNPFQPFKNFKEITAVFKECQNVAMESYAKGGYSFGGGYFMLDGSPGTFEGKYYQAMERQMFKNRPVYTRYKNGQ